MTTTHPDAPQGAAPEVEARIKELLPKGTYTPPEITYCGLVFGKPRSSNQTIQHLRNTPARGAGNRITKASRANGYTLAIEWVKAQGLTTNVVQGYGAVDGPKLKKPGRTIERAAKSVFACPTRLEIRVWYGNRIKRGCAEYRCESSHRRTSGCRYMAW
jgi:hypothetical protein